MILEKLIAMICDELGIESSDIDGDTVLGDIVSDEFELQELVEAIEGELEISIDDEPSLDWTVAELEQAVSAAY